MTDRLESPLSAPDRARLLLDLYMHIDNLRWRLAANAITAAVVILAGGAWVATSLGNVSAELDQYRRPFFGILVLFSAFVMLIGVLIKVNTIPHLNAVRKELAETSSLKYLSREFDVVLVRAPLLATIIMIFAALFLTASGLVLLSGPDALIHWIERLT